MCIFPVLYSREINALPINYYYILSFELSIISCKLLIFFSCFVAISIKTAFLLLLTILVRVLKCS